MTIETSPQAAIIGAGPAGLMAAEVLAAAGIGVTVYERMPSAGRKFLLAGRGGLNVTHSEPLAAFLGRYREAEAALRPAIEAFSPEDLRGWCEGLGQTTFVGSSGRVFPVSLKTSPLLRAWLGRLGGLGVQFKLRHRWLGWDADGALQFAAPDGTVAVKPDLTVLALGGASWPQLGSDGSWTAALAAAGVEIAPLRPSNSGFLANWSPHFRERFAGQPLKGIALTIGRTRVRSEAMITQTGLEGSGIYALSPELREAIAATGEARLYIDLLPLIPLHELQPRLAKSREKQSLSGVLRKATKLPPAAVGLMHEVAISQGTPLSGLSRDKLAEFIKGVPVRLVGVAPIERAISTAGGVALEAVDAGFMLKAKPGTFVAGEMLDWEAPTGGYLLQASFATGAAAARGALEWLAERRQSEN
ncbi:MULTISPECIES: TIGR03862 family flavoprotein [Rhodomicrobium]|uniref:NAD(P)/FAD-dependent oxidoreductase n=1 Tax=Rhodomicrobium TaxID=1068 RepID=UPI000B4BE4E1|nr:MULTISPECIES: TIGR03862 family flavoprotein [Rhodomicrobium]